MSLRNQLLRAAGVATALTLGAAWAWAADDAPHWAYQPLKKVTPPRVAGAPSKSPIDAFIEARWAGAGLTPAPLADRRTWLRRVYFDLIGLPPTPAELRAFERDSKPGAESRVVNRLLASPRYGERWARHWMDAAHFAETHGHDQDRIRTNAWPYRDYLVESFNSDKPYARFVQEQVAGDVLFPESPAATVALGFIAAGPWDESSLRDIREDTLDRQIGRYLDRDDMLTTVMSVVTSTTVHCARCHDHKFDPIPQADYYALQAVFAGVDRANRTWDEDPEVHLRRRELRALQRRVERRDAALLLSAEAEVEVERWEADRPPAAIDWTPIEPQTFLAANGSSLKRLADDSLVATGPRPDKEAYTITAALPMDRVTAIRLEVLADEGLPSFGPGRADNGNFHLSEFEVRLFQPGAAEGRLLRLADPTADFDQTDWTIRHAIDGNEKTAWGIHPRVGTRHEAVFQLQEPIRPPRGSVFTWTLRQQHGGSHLIGRFRISVTDADPPVQILPFDLARTLETRPDQRTENQRLELARFVLERRIAEMLGRLPAPSWVYAAASDFEPDGGLRPAPGPRPVALLRRGEITQPREAAQPGSLTCVSGVAARFSLQNLDDEGARRAALAQWLTDPQNPLTWRSIVNRVWQHHFGRGLVDTANDFGKLGSLPSHPELLEWLAVWFRDQARGSFKELHRLLVTSEAYRRASIAPPNAPDPDNRWLSRMTRTRLDAESIRDAILQFSGQLDLRMGGPSDQQFDLQPGIHVTPKVDYAKFDLDSPTGSRRSVYRFLFRTLPDPFMEALDCPAGDQLTAARNNSVTVQQALALWNNAFVARQAQHFATRLESLARDPASRVGLACELVWGRVPEPSQTRDLLAYAQTHGWPNFCRLLLNSNEFIFVN